MHKTSIVAIQNLPHKFDIQSLFISLAN